MQVGLPIGLRVICGSHRNRDLHLFTEAVDQRVVELLALVMQKYVTYPVAEHKTHYELVYLQSGLVGDRLRLWPTSEVLGSHDYVLVPPGSLLEGPHQINAPSVEQVMNLEGV